MRTSSSPRTLASVTTLASIDADDLDTVIGGRGAASSVASGALRAAGRIGESVATDTLGALGTSLGNALGNVITGQQQQQPAQPQGQT